ncbi:MAG: 5'-nucleotidase C-terminal domain-containing protein, partial [Lachnospiraceae bacterium]|nr:5'-nucleotidase C-terminal domain-containing protein [Lachnospiraceae bacterium]
VNITDEFDERDFKLLAGNVVNDDSSRFFDDEFLIKSVEKDGKELKIGIFGMIDPLIYDSTSPKNVAGLTFTDMEVYAKKAVENLKSEGCQFIIALTHSYAPVELAAKIDGVDLWLAGHEHISINQTAMTPSGKETLVIENGYYLYEVGLLSIDITLNDNDEVTDISYTADSTDYSDSTEITPDNDVLNLLEDIDSRQAEILNEVVGSSPVGLDGVWESLRIDETTMGRAVTDSYLLETGADVAFENAGGIRSSINSGDVTYGDIINVLPYGNYIVTKQVTGAELREILETSIDIQIKNIAANDSGIYDAWPGNSGSYLQVGGMTVKYNCSNEYGNRVVSVLVGGTPLEDDRLYTVATNNFVAVSTDYPQLAEKNEINEYSACDEALITFFRQNEETILNSVSTARMIQTSESGNNDDNESSEQTKPTETKEESQTTESSDMPDNRTDVTVPSTIDNTSAESSSPVATGDNADGYMVIIIAMAAMVFIFVSCKNKNLKTNSD